MIPAGWTVDPADPSVGIFGDTWCHDACEKSDGMELVITLDYRNDGKPEFITELTHLRCVACGATGIFEQVQWVGPDDPDEQ